MIWYTLHFVLSCRDWPCIAYRMVKRALMYIGHLRIQMNNGVGTHISFLFHWFGCTMAILFTAAVASFFGSPENLSCDTTTQTA